jgi:hypothetical protein
MYGKLLRRKAGSTSLMGINTILSMIDSIRLIIGVRHETNCISTDVLE